MSELDSRYAPRTTKETVSFAAAPVVELKVIIVNVEVPVFAHREVILAEGLIGDATTKKFVGAAVIVTS